ncbi:bifunctional glutamate N-acetyltransferase/amino-acid acetyltransferase ArgJ [Vallitalea okinawensis]|uniref:bifunctional glutamate N-acetyltransferase/amino-acid acetyltransferase ArgJ n=1 Tax=Vallitalea okinawensis TaxID=2078660 RepID=UPI000CFE1352|nr:bifunctional glutamate N-acetyltransferase/amino-acid acetyltransferase ArgJ [Vallitalea okinawensis]
MIQKNKGITYPTGFMAAGSHVGLKKKKKDLSMVVSTEKANMAAVFTTNKVKAAPVLWNQKVHQLGKGVKALVINSGNANACTGEIGHQHTEQMAEQMATSFEVKADEVLIASTGVIGVPLPIDKVIKGIQKVAPTVCSDDKAGQDAAEGIITTDTFIKQGAIQVQLENQVVRIGGMAKGSGMIHPNMATMLSFITTDANVDPLLLQEMLTETTEDTYNMISVDGDTSTNDMVIALANGSSNGSPIIKGTKDYKIFKGAFLELNIYLAREIVRDGEGAGKLIKATVNGTATKRDAKLLAKAIVGSNLVKTAFFGEDANWGRILCAMGYSGAQFNPNQVDIRFLSKSGLIEVFKNGIPVSFSEDKALTILKEDEVEVLVNVYDGIAHATAWGCDLSYEYVRINGEYRT